MFAKSIKPGQETGAAAFFQVEADSSASPQGRAYDELKRQAQHTHSLRLAALASTVRVAKAGHFDKVIGAIDDMIVILKDEGLVDMQKRDECKKQYLSIASTSADEKWSIEKNEAKIDKLENQIAMRQEEVANTVAEIEDTQENIKTMEDERIAEHDAFNNAQDDDREAIRLLKKAKVALESYSKNNNIDMGEIQGSSQGFLQAGPDFEVSEDQAPDADFASKDSHKGQSKGIVSLMTMFIEDLQDEVSNGIKNEGLSQMEFEKALKTAQDLESDLKDKKVNLEDIIAKRNKSKGEEHDDKDDNNDDLQDEVDFKGRIQKDCDWILGAFEGRAAGRAQEQSGLEAAKAHLAGAAGSASLTQTSHKKFDDNALGRSKFLGMKA